MSTPQNPIKRLRQKRRRTKQLAEWRAQQETKKPEATKAEPAKK